MVESVRRGKSLRIVADEYHVGKSTVEFWVNRAKGKRLDRVDWTDRADGPKTPRNKVSVHVEQCVLAIRKDLKKNSPLGEHGADAVRNEMQRLGCVCLPSRASINRVFERNGAFDGRKRKRLEAPPPGWYLPDVAAGNVELDQFDHIEDLCLEGGRILHVLNGISLHGGLVYSKPISRMTSENTVQNLISFWKEFGLPNYAQFDNSTVFLGSRTADSLGKVIRCCLSLDVTPVFVPPHTHGFQASIENYNGRWQNGVWKRFHFENLRAVDVQSGKFVGALRNKLAVRTEGAPARWEFPHGWKLDYQQELKGKVIFIRRTDENGCVEVMGHRWTLDRSWPHRLVRAEVDLTGGVIDFHRLRRREPEDQPWMGRADYRFPKRKFHE